MFTHMLVNEKMITFITSLNIPLYVYIMLLRSYSVRSDDFLKFRET